MTDDRPSYESCKAALSILAPRVLGIVPHVSGLGIQGEDSAKCQVVVYVDKGAKATLLAGGAIPASVRVGSDANSVAVPVVIEEQDALKI